MYNHAAQLLRLPKDCFPLVFGHRGFAARAPENTLPAFELAAQHGVPAVEFDVQLSADDKVVVFHDHDLRRLAGSTARVEELSAAELGALDLGSRYGAAFAGAGIPTLAQVVACLPRGTVLDIEVKVHHGRILALARAVAQAIMQLEIAPRTIVSSFHPGVLWHLSRLMPQVPRAIIYSRHAEVPWYLQRGWGGIAVNAAVYKPHFPLVAPRLCARVPVFPWTLNEPAEALRVLHAGAAGLTGDDPVMLMDTVTQFRSALNGG